VLHGTHHQSLGWRTNATVKESQANKFLWQTPQVIGKLARCWLWDGWMDWWVFKQWLQQQQVTVRSTWCSRCGDPGFQVDPYCEHTHIMSSSLFCGCQFELSLEHPDLETVYDFGHPAGVAHCSGWHESLSSDRSSTEKDNHKFQEFFIIISRLNLLKMLVGIIDGALLYVFQYACHVSSLQSLVHTWPCLWIPSVLGSVWRVVPREKMWLPYTLGILHQLSVP